MSNKCPVCLKEFGERSSVIAHMKRRGHTLAGNKFLARESDEARMAAYHREKTGEKVEIVRYGK